MRIAFLCPYRTLDLPSGLWPRRDYLAMLDAMFIQILEKVICVIWWTSVTNKLTRKSMDGENLVELRDSWLYFGQVYNSHFWKPRMFVDENQQVLIRRESSTKITMSNIYYTVPLESLSFLGAPGVVYYSLLDRKCILLPIIQLVCPFLAVNFGKTDSSRHILQ